MFSRDLLTYDRDSNNLRVHYEGKTYNAWMVVLNMSDINEKPRSLHKAGYNSVLPILDKQARLGNISSICHEEDGDILTLGVQFCYSFHQDMKVTTRRRKEYDGHIISVEVRCNTRNPV